MKRLAIRCSCAAILLAGFATELPAQQSRPSSGPTTRVVATVEAGKMLAPISPLMYGMFVEHARQLVNQQMWSEMLDDRKFYYPVLAANAPQPEPPSTLPGQPQRRRPETVRRWHAIGPDDAVTMDTKRAYAGDQAVAVALADQPRGIAQEGVNVLQGKAYAGRIVLAGDAGAKATATLIVGDGDANRQAVSIDGLAPDYKTFPLTFTSPGGGKARIEITGTGAGTLRVGAVSLMPADNVQGWKPEVIAVLKKPRSGIYRWPGGNFVSAHDWRDAIGDPDKRPPIYDPVWMSVQPNDVGSDEFMTLCRLIKVEPYITVNAGWADARSAAEYVEYANSPKSTEWGAKRAANGHPEPYGVKYWNIGNEMWGSYQYGYMPVNQYVAKHNLFAKQMRKVDPAIVLVGDGAMPDTLTGSEEALKLGDKLIPDYLSPADWTGQMFLHCADNMDLISEHFYNSATTHLDLKVQKKLPNDPNEPLTDWMRRPANHVRLKYEEYKEYEKRIPALAKKPIPIALDEYAYTGGNYKVVPAYAWNFHELFRHADVYKFANLTFATAMFNASNGQAVLTPTGVLYKMYRDHFGMRIVDVTGNSPQPIVTDPVGGEQPAVNAGSPTFPLDVCAAWTDDHAALTVAVVNPTDVEQTMDLKLNGAELSGKGTLHRIAPKSMTANNVVGQEQMVKVDDEPIDAVPRSVTLPPLSISIYELSSK